MIRLKDLIADSVINEDRSAFDAIKPGSKVTLRMKRHGTVRGVADRYDKRKDVWHVDVLVGDETAILTRDNFVSLGGMQRPHSIGSRPLQEDATTAGSLRKQLRAAKFKKARNVPAGLSSYVKPALQDIWIRGNVVVLTNGILWQAYTDDGGSIGSGTDRDKIMDTLSRSSWTNF